MPKFWHWLLQGPRTRARDRATLRRATKLRRMSPAKLRTYTKKRARKR